MMRGRICSGIVVALVAIVSEPVLAAENMNGRNWAATCTGCHGTDGRSEGGMPGLAGLQKAYIVNAMREFKAGTRSATVMHQHAKGYTDEQIERIAEFFAAQKLD
jgi:sulfide dehydrogenase cytochrome subunit